jgi:Kef-type K+ transport system membrane component KefB
VYNTARVGDDARPGLAQTARTVGMIASTSKAGGGFFVAQQLAGSKRPVMDNIWLPATIWMTLALAASLISIRLGISVALIEILVGVIGGNFLNLRTMPWIDFLAGFGAVLLTFLAGAEIEPSAFRRNLKKSLSIGLLSFLVPFIAAGFFAYFVMGWDLKASEIAGIALSTTSVAVVYAVMIESKLNETNLGKLILAACFVTDLGTVLALGIIFAKFDWWMLILALVTGFSLWLVPKSLRWVASRWGSRVSEPGIKFIMLGLFLLGWLATTARSEAVLPAYLIGLGAAGSFTSDRALLTRIRTMAFAVFTPFYFIRAGMYISLAALVLSFGWIMVLLCVKVGTKYLGVFPLAKVYKMNVREGHYTTLLMSTGLTFGSISALFGLTNHYIDQFQYTVLVTVVIGSALIPTIIAQSFFKPRPLALDEKVIMTESVADVEDGNKE